MDWERVRQTDYLIPNKVLARLTGLRWLKIHSSFEDRQNAFIWSFIQESVSPVRRLTHVSLSSECWGLYLKHVFEYLDVPSPKELDLDGVSEAKDGAFILRDKVRLST